MMKVCTQCTKKFELSGDGESVYTQLGIPSPTECSDCMRRLRYTFRNERTLYMRPCGLCNKQFLSMFAPDLPHTVYCIECWHGDGWDAKACGREIDWERPFFDQFAELVTTVPLLGIIVTRSENCDYCNMVMGAKNCYLSTRIADVSELYYCHLGLERSHQCVDCNTIKQTERSYETMDSERCYQCIGASSSVGCTDCIFVDDCRDCQDCVCCAGISHKQYYLFNKPSTKEEIEKYKKKIRSYGGYQEVLEEYKKFLPTVPKRATFLINSDQCTGDYIFDSGNCKRCFNVVGTRDSVDVKDCEFLENTAHVDMGINSQWCYNTIGFGDANSIMCSWTTIYSSFLTYCISCFTSQDCFGCVGMKKGQYAILNKEYSKEENSALRSRIIEGLRGEGQWGKFLPAYVSPFAYNETIAQDFYPFTKEEADARGFRWRDELPGSYGKETIAASDLPDTIDEVTELILREVLACTCDSCGGHRAVCGRNYKIIKQELGLYQSLGIPLPRRCPLCRHRARVNRRNPQILYNRTCFQCGKNVETTYAPDRPELVYCEQCYQKEIV